MKRKYADRPDWKRVTERNFQVQYINTTDYCGYISLFEITKVNEPLIVEYNRKNYCVADSNYLWLQHFPNESNYVLTTVFDPNDKVVQWYIDICHEKGITGNGIPWFDDLYLDIVMLPDGTIIELDMDELNEAYNNQIITESQFNLAIKENNRISELLMENKLKLLELSIGHKKSLFS
jgi:predicted RNA-binding protein associated with RNAse of E/G family